jgi:hypothetical protein
MALGRCLAPDGEPQDHANGTRISNGARIANGNGHANGNGAAPRG